MEKETFRPVFIVGVPRSGTTLFAAHIDRHSRIAVPPETQYFVGVLPCGRPSGKHGGHDYLITELFKNWRILDLGIDKDDVLELFKKYKPNYKNLLRATLESYTIKERKFRSAEKSPMHLDYVPLILYWYPSAKIICIVRDGRDVVLSLMKVPWHKRKSLAAFSAMWNFYINLIKKYIEKFKDSFYVLKYEDFILSPEYELTKVCEFIGENFEYQQLDYKLNSMVVTHREENWKKKALTIIDTSRKEAWRKTNSRDIYLMNKIMEENLRYWGYEVYYENNRKIYGILTKILPIIYLDNFYRKRRNLWQFIKLILCRIGLKKPLKSRNHLEKLSKRQTNGN